MDGPGLGNPYERELMYYRRECNELGARLLRLQEEQSQAHREARRSRTVVRLVRETYRIGDLARTAHDVGGPILEVIVDNALCDAAALLREEPRGSGQFLVAHAIGVADAAAAVAAVIRDPPEFCYTASAAAAVQAPDGLLDVLRMPFVLWAYDRSSGYALVIGNRSEGNVSRPFEPGDQELVESALSVYLDVLYRKQAEAQLRQAKQAAEEASLERTRFLDRLSRELSEPLQEIAASSEALASALAPLAGLEAYHERARRVARDAQRVLALAEQATRFVTPEEQPPLLDVEWTGLAEMVGKVIRFHYAQSLKRGVDLAATLPRRAVAVCVDRERMQRALQTLVGDALAAATHGASVRLHATRRGDGAVEIVVSTTAQFGAVRPSGPQQADDADRGGSGADGAEPRAKLDAPRRIVGAHGGVVVAEIRPNGERQTRVILPARIARDDELAGARHP